MSASRSDFHSEARSLAIQDLAKADEEAAGVMTDSGQVRMVSVPPDGDCFFRCVCNALRMLKPDQVAAVKKRLATTGRDGVVEIDPATCQPGRLRELVAARLLNKHDEQAGIVLANWIAMRDAYRKILATRTPPGATPEQRRQLDHERRDARVQLDTGLKHVNGRHGNIVDEVCRREVAAEVRKSSFWGEQFSIDTLSNVFGIRFLVFDAEDRAMSVGMVSELEGIARDGPVTMVLPIRHDTDHYTNIYHVDTGRIVFRPNDVPCSMIRTMRDRKNFSMAGIDGSYLDRVIRAQDFVQHQSSVYLKQLRKQEATRARRLADKTRVVAGEDVVESLGAYTVSSARS